MWQEFQSLFRRRRVLQYFVGRELTVTYRNKALGNIWALLEPLMIMVILTLVFENLRHSSMAISLYLFAGLIGWDFFSKTVSSCALCVRKYRFIIHKYPLPLSLYPLVPYFVRFNDFLWGLAAYCVMYFVFNHYWELHLSFFSPAMLLLPLWILGYSAIAVGVGFIFARLGVLFGDMENLATILLRAGFFLNPIFILMPTLPAQYHKTYLLLNPLAGYLLYLRVLLPGGEPLLDGYKIAVPYYPLVLAAWSAGIFLFGFWVFTRGSRHFAKFL